MLPLALFPNPSAKLLATLQEQAMSSKRSRIHSKYKTKSGSISCWGDDIGAFSDAWNPAKPRTTSPSLFRSRRCSCC